MISSKMFGTILIVAGTTIGASMLALPLKTAEIGFSMGLVFMAAAWLFMLANAYIILLITKPYPEDATFHTIVKDVLGIPGWIAMTGAFFWLFYALLAAYASGASGLISSYVGGHPKLIGSLIFLILSAIVLWNTQVTDYINRALFILKMVIFMLILWPLVSQINWGAAGGQFYESSLFSYTSASVAVLLIYITSFGFHGSITSLVKYNQGDRKKLRIAFFWGTFLSVVLYLIWIFISLSLSGGDVKSLSDMSAMIQYMSSKSGLSWVALGLNLFAILAVLTSFLGVGLGLSNYFRDMLDSVPFLQKPLNGLLTFVPPYLIMMVDPTIFVQALEFAGVALVFIAVLMPNLILMRLVSTGALICSGWVRLGSFCMLLSSLILIPLYFMGSF